MPVCMYINRHIVSHKQWRSITSLDWKSERSPLWRVIPEWPSPPALRVPPAALRTQSNAGRRDAWPHLNRRRHVEFEIPPNMCTSTCHHSRCHVADGAAAHQMILEEGGFYPRLQSTNHESCDPGFWQTFCCHDFPLKPSGGDKIERFEHMDAMGILAPSQSLHTSQVPWQKNIPRILHLQSDSIEASSKEAVVRNTVSESLEPA